MVSMGILVKLRTSQDGKVLYQLPPLTIFFGRSPPTADIISPLACLGMYFLMYSRVAMVVSMG